jgi:hypothetical protein
MVVFVFEYRGDGRVLVARVVFALGDYDRRGYYENGKRDQQYPLYDDRHACRRACDRGGCVRYPGAEEPQRLLVPGRHLPTEGDDSDVIVLAILGRIEQLLRKQAFSQTLGLVTGSVLVGLGGWVLVRR